uniref:Lipocalin/cytosolic fatty-acid binding domain-containing protein n=1 Tax=Ditylenchus dipsaci TaxID=166011 RepID=A0A915E2F3_9BILA
MLLRGLCFVLLGLISASAASNSSAMPVTTVSSINLTQYMGKWYEIARLPNRFQKESEGSVVWANYFLNADGTVNVHNAVDYKDGTNQSVDGVGRCPDPKNYPAQLEVTFVPSWLRWIPFVWGKYWVIGLDTDYKWSVVGHPSRSYFWILAREPKLANSTFEQAKANATSMGYDLSNLIITGTIVFNLVSINQREKKSATGSNSLPLVGNLWTIMNNQPGERQFLKWSREYGPIYTYWVGELPVVCITDFNKIIETFQKDGETYAGRYNAAEMDKLLKGGTAGVIFTEGELWRDQRRFTLHVLRDFGLGKNLMQENVLSEVDALIFKIDAENEKGKTEHNVHSHIDMAVGSIINKLLFGYRYSEWNPKLFKDLPVFKSRFDETVQANDQLYQFYEKRIREHEAELDLDEPLLIITSLLHCFDLWVAGQETTSTTLAWGVGDRQITLADRPNLPFTNAVVNETQRVCNLVPQNKGTCILPQISAVLCNDDIFQNAEKFDPNRFLDVNGQLKKCDELIPFSVGKRQCLGEALARMELFLFLANIFNTFKVSACATPPSLTRSFGGTVQCPPYLCKMQRRHS